MYGRASVAVEWGPPKMGPHVTGMMGWGLMSLGKMRSLNVCHCSRETSSIILDSGVTFKYNVMLKYQTQCNNYTCNNNKNRLILHNNIQAQLVETLCNPSQSKYNHHSQLSHWNLWIMLLYTSGTLQSQHNFTFIYRWKELVGWFKSIVWKGFEVLLPEALYKIDKQ